MVKHGRAAARRVLVAHPFPLVVEALAALLADRGFTVDRAADAAAAKRSLREHPVAIAIVALDLGLDLVRTLGRGAAMRTILLSDDLAVGPLREAVAIGVDGVLSTRASIETVATCLAAVTAGEQWLDPEATRLVADDDERAAGPALTPRERDVAKLVAAGQRNRSIAGALGISEGTVKMHLHNVYGKLGLESRTQLAMDARARE